MAGKKTDAKQFASQKRRRRKWITTMRMVRYGVNNFSRNAWLTIAATAVMTITLLIVFTTLVARNTLITTVDAIRDQVDMSVYLKLDATDDQIKKVTNKIKGLDSVRGVSFVSPQAQRSDFAKDNSDDPDTLSALNEAQNQFPPTLRVSVKDINNTSELSSFISTDKEVKEAINPTRAPSFAGDRKAAIENIARWVSFADRAGLIVTVLFVVISSLIVFNTIRMAIFNRKEEIQMMKLIGADRSFIRGPFVVEAVVYGFIAAVIATGIGILGLLSAQDKLESYKIAIGPTVDFVVMYIGFILLGMILLGATIGVVSSLLATRRYLKL
jgi:cell division transport system permease protein